MVGMGFMDGLRKLTKAVAVTQVPTKRISYDWGTVVKASPNPEIIMDTDPSATAQEISASGVGPLEMGWRVLLRIEGQRLEVLAAPGVAGKLGYLESVVLMGANSNSNLRNLLDELDDDLANVEYTVNTGPNRNSRLRSDVSSLFNRLAPLEEDTGWVPFSPFSGFTAGSTLAYRVRNGVRELRGTITRDAQPFGTGFVGVATLPAMSKAAGYVIIGLDTGGNNAGQLAVNSSGDISIKAFGTGSSRAWLDGVSYLSG